MININFKFISLRNYSIYDELIRLRGIDILNNFVINEDISEDNIFVTIKRKVDIVYFDYEFIDETTIEKEGHFDRRIDFISHHNCNLYRYVFKKNLFENYHNYYLNFVLDYFGEKIIELNKIKSLIKIYIVENGGTDNLNYIRVLLLLVFCYSYNNILYLKYLLKVLCNVLFCIVLTTYRHSVFLNN